MQNTTATKTARSAETELPLATQVLPELQSRIAVRAYQLYEQSGYVPGRDIENWLRAEQEVVNDDLG